MAQLITVRLTRNDNQPWGFRLQGGKDFGSPLALQKVNVGSIADKAGLLAGDALIKVNNEELFNLRHKDAQDAIVRAGASFELTVSRGGSTWKPAVTPLTSPVPTSAGVNVLTKTSLQAKPGQNPAAIGTGHNTAARPFASKEPSVKSVVNKQYNSPVAMYSDETIAETLSAQTEVLAGGVLGVNFKKNEKVYNSAQSEVFKMLQEQGNEPEPARPSSVYSPSSHFPQHPLNDQHSSVSDGVTKHVTAPVNVPKPPSNNGLPPGQNICADCERLIVGVFVRIKDKNLHVECFKCSTCGSSLKNQGYYNFNNKLYCDIHAKLAAMSSPPPNTNGLVPVTVPPKAPTSTISSALNAHAGALNGSSVAPAVPTTAHLPSSISGPKPFSYAPVPAPAPVSAPKSPIAYPPPAAPAWTAPVSAPVQTAPAWTPAPAPVNEAAKAPAAQQLQGKLNVFRQPQPQSQAPTATPKRESQPSIEIDSVVPEQQQQQQQQPQQQEEVKEEPQTVQNQSVSEEAQNQQQQQVQESLNNSRRASINQTQEEQLTQRKVSQVEQQVRLQQQVEQQSYASQSETMRRGSIQDRQSKFEQPVQQETIQQQAPKQSPPKQQQEQQQPQETSELDKEVQDTVAPRIRIVEPRWRTPSRQYLHEFEASSSSGQQNEVFSSDPNEMLRPTTPSSRPWTPSSRSQHRSSHIPYYQEQLAWEEGVALSKEFEKKLRTPSPNPMMMRPKSPAFGPPPNPLLLIHPQTRDEGKDLSGKYLSGTKLLSPMWETQHYKNEYLGVDTDNPYYEKQQKSSSQKYYESPEMIQRQRVGDTQVETRARESHAEQQKKAEMERSSVQQVGNATIQRKTRVVEEFEHTSSAKTVEVQKTKGATLTIQDDEFPPRGFVAQQARRLSTADSDTTSNNITKRQVGGGQEPRDYTVPTFQSQVSVQQQSSSQMQSYSAQSNTTNSQISQYSFPTQSGMVPPPGFPTSAQASQITNVIQRQQQQAASSFNTNTTNKATLPQPQQATNNNSDRQSNNLPSSLNNNNKNYEPSPISSSNTNPSKKTSSDPVPGLGGISGKPYNVQNVTQPKRGRGILNQAAVGRAPVCGCCSGQVRGPFITALGRIWCPEHFICVNANCKRPLADIGFVEEKGDLYCEYCFEQYLAPNCSKCVKKIKGDCLNAIGRQFHPECFTCSYCGKLFGNSPFFLEEGEPYCQNDWNELFTTKCFACGFPVEAGDRWVEALNNNYHSQCFNCTMCKKNLEGQSFYAKGGRPFCKNHAQYNYLKKKTQFIINLNISKYFNTITHIMYVNNKIKTILKFKFKH
uniref:CSON014743 protein n=1 Tax=Culicoides sonorensis TaxID=179676 RepID=A0A336MEA7_CULSO